MNTEILAVNGCIFPAAGPCGRACSLRTGNRAGRLVPALVCGYGFAWIGHFFFAKSRPATFRHPFCSLPGGDWVILADVLRGRRPL